MAIVRHSGRKFLSSFLGPGHHGARGNLRKPLRQWDAAALGPVSLREGEVPGQSGSGQPASLLAFPSISSPPFLSQIFAGLL